LSVIVDIIVDVVVGTAVDAAVKRAKIQRIVNIASVVFLTLLAVALIYFAVVPESL
jgi:threonine/homoserine/homoserine lactone efflux protein